MIVEVSWCVSFVKQKRKCLSAVCATNFLNPTHSWCSAFIDVYLSVSPSLVAVIHPSPSVDHLTSSHDDPSLMWIIRVLVNLRPANHRNVSSTDLYVGRTRARLSFDTRVWAKESEICYVFISFIRTRNKASLVSLCPEYHNVIVHVRTIPRILRCLENMISTMVFVCATCSLFLMYLFDNSIVVHVTTIIPICTFCHGIYSSSQKNLRPHLNV